MLDWADIDTVLLDMDGTLLDLHFDNYFWLVVEKEPPFSATLYEFMPDDIEYCMDEFHYTLKLVADAIAENKFPSYSQRADNKHGILQARLPLYYKQY
jgi:FMN phosphatase YigB (HAD superfamily)